MMRAAEHNSPKSSVEQQQYCESTGQWRQKQSWACSTKTFLLLTCIGQLLVLLLLLLLLLHNLNQQSYTGLLP